MTMVDEKAWHAAWAERPRLLAIARRRSLDRSDAEEAVSEAVLRAVIHPGLRPGDLPAFLTATTMRLCVDRLRERTMLERNAQRMFVRPPDGTDDVLDRAEAAWLAAEVARLADKERAALVARMLGLTVQETAEALGVTYKSAESALDRAKRKMRAVWARTLALLPLRPRRARAAVAVLAAAAVVTSLAVWQHRYREPRPVEAPTVERAQVVRTSEARTERAPSTSAKAPPVRTVHPARESSSAPPLRLATPDLRAGPLRQEPVVVTLDTANPVAHLRRCVKEGLAVETGSRVGVTCRYEGTTG